MMRERIARTLAAKLSDMLGYRMKADDFGTGPLADAVLAAIEGAGMAIVPREPTEEMIAQGIQHGTAINVWQSMIHTYSTVTDTRPEIEPTFFAYRELPDDPDDAILIWREMCAPLQQNGATFFRMTVASDQYPKPPYPHGLYLEGWAVDPAHMDPPGQQAPFNFPMTAPPCS